MSVGFVSRGTPAFRHMFQKAGQISLILLAACWSVAGQDSTALRFDAVSIKPAPANVVPVFKGGPGSTDPGRVSWARATLRDLVVSASGVRRSQISGPEWIDSEFYAVMATMPPSTTQPEVVQMIGNLLKDRFHFAFHRESRTVLGYELVVDKVGAKIRVGSSPPQSQAPDRAETPLITRGQPDAKGFPILGNGQPWQTRVEEGTFKGTFNCTLSAFAGMLPRLMALHSPYSPEIPVVDKTGMLGTYSFKLSLDNDSESFLSNLNDALVRQLGLRLQQSKLTSDYLVIDHLDRAPTPN